MKGKMLLVVCLALAQTVFATNGSNLTSVSPASRGMGGIGVGMPVGAVDTTFKNPAWMPYYKDFHVSFDGILFLPSVKARTNLSPMGPMNPPAFEKSEVDRTVIPGLGIVDQYNDKLWLGMAAYGVSGFGVDYRNKDRRLANMHTNFQFLRIMPSFAYKVNESFSVGGSIHIGYGSLDMGANLCRPATPPTCWNAGGGQSQTFGAGFQVGFAFNSKDKVFAGFTYQSPISMTYKRVFDSDGNGSFEDFKLYQPQEVAFGFGVKPSENLKVGTDFRWINWKNAKGYEGFQWKDQLVIAVGSEYEPAEGVQVRAGWNYGKSPIRSGTKNPATSRNIPNFTAPFNDLQIAYFNLVGFPAITEHHISLGVGYKISENFGLDISYEHVFNKKITATDTLGIGFITEAQNAQNSLSIGLKWNF
ncbi:MAG: outer membrane protein transport protein [Pyrinomonadaceae bacterium]|nr:outer membrane protein transport protein [Pyrinomonadaceae bacterium]MCX7639109.1 outer membrane protein transport protein [Pyrinomonadaceae bacterium]MDW8303670.1 outer membrane protein transport protein [Acidobacteriota bacterium]